MDTKEFLKIASENISDDPRTRLSAETKELIDDPNCILDIHTHIFDRKCLSIGYILLRMGKSLMLQSLGIEAVDNEVDKMKLLSKSEEEIYNSIEKAKTDSMEDWEQLEKELEKTIELNETYELFGFDLKEALKVLKKKNMLEVLDFYRNDFSLTNLPEFQDKKMAIGILQMDLETGWNFTPRRNFKQQIDDIKEIASKRPIIPFMAIDPRRADVEGNNNLYKLFLDAFCDKSASFFGLKCYPAMGYLPSDIRLDPIFEICAGKNIPILTHNGGEIVSTFEKIIKIKNNDGYFDFEIPGKYRTERAYFLNDPGHWDSVLNKHKKLKINFGHFGGDDNWLEFSNTGKNQRIEKILSMMRNPDWRVYGDFSFNVVEGELFDKFKSVLDTFPEIASRTLYGTDYWVVLPAGELLQMQKEFIEKLQKHQIAILRDNIIDYLLK